MHAHAEPPPPHQANIVIPIAADEAEVIPPHQTNIVTLIAADVAEEDSYQDETFATVYKHRAI